ncbi:hypothetical protein [Nonomuraea sp. NPDC050643]|uniref:hypothetical protein n=1 Tax=Nonomuraea sp. NPDC050643 TaxID=3155660 RepID=UPI00340074DE
MTTTPTTVADELRTAAAKLRETARGASRGPWLVGDCELYPRWMLSEGERDERGYNADVARICEDEADTFTVTDANWQWMGFAHPGLAEPLAAWLEEIARQYDAPPCDDPTGVCSGCERREDFNDALTVAQVINRTST